MEVKVTPYKRSDHIEITGRIDSDSVSKLEELINSLNGAGRYKLVFDMSEVTFISSAGWWLLIDTQKKCRRYKRGEVALACLDERIRDSLNLVGMGDYFNVFDDIVSAIGSV